MIRSLSEKLDDELKVFWEQNRRKTFKKWVYKDTAFCNASKMAEAGFVFCGTKHEPDSVKCFFCHKSLDYWDEDDDPWAEHRKHSPQCKFAGMDKPEDEFTFAELSEMRNEFIINLFKSKGQQNVDNYQKDFAEIIEKIKTAK